MTSSLRKLLIDGCLLASVSVAIATGCGDDDDPPATAGTGGKGGTGGASGGTAGKGGAAGKGGSAGTSTGGSSGKGGTSGTGGGGTGGNSGTAGTSTGGSAGTVVGGQGGEVADSGAGGEGGAPVLGATCAGYCTTLMATCGETGANAQYPTEAQCLASCATFPTDVTTGNSLGCRNDHAALAATAGVDPHCDHAGPAGLGPCGGACPAYCSLMMAVCAGEFTDEAECLTACAAVPEGNFSNYVYPAPGGDTLSCRIAHATNAAAAEGASRMSHCGHAAGAAPCAP